MVSLSGFGRPQSLLISVGVTKTYRLTYEAVEVLHALFNKHAAKNTWTISAFTLKAFGEYFGVNTEQLDISSEEGRATFTSYTEKVATGKGLAKAVLGDISTEIMLDILKQPLHTSITIDNLDFEAFEVEESLHIGITVKDFRAIATHAETLKTSVTALYSYPARPIHLSYHTHGMQCEYTLMTVGEYRGPSITPNPPASKQATGSPMQQSTKPQRNTALPVVERKTTAMPPPSHPASRNIIKELPTSQRFQRPSPPPPKASLDPESLFLPQYDDEDRQWGEKNFDEEEDTVGWSASAANVYFLSPLSQPQADESRPGAIRRLEKGGSRRDYSRMFPG